MQSKTMFSNLSSTAKSTDDIVELGSLVDQIKRKNPGLPNVVLDTLKGGEKYLSTQNLD